MIKTIIFDNHGVLVTSNVESVYPAMSQILSPDMAREFERAYQEHKEKADRGEITSLALFELIAREIDSPVSPEKLREVAYGSFVERSGMAEIVRACKKGYQVAVLTDITDYFWEMTKKWPVIKEFDRKNVFVSSEIGMIKPAPEIYRFVLERLNIRPEEAVFIDDYPANVSAAQKLGINAILFTDVAKLKEDLSQYVEI